MALPRISEVNVPARPQEPILLAEATERAGAYTIEQLETLLQPLLLPKPRQRERAWLPLQSLAFIVGTSTLLWAVILFVAIKLL